MNDSKAAQTAAGQKTVCLLTFCIIEFFILNEMLADPRAAMAYPLVRVHLIKTLLVSAFVLYFNWLNSLKLI